MTKPTRDAMKIRWWMFQGVAFAVLLGSVIGIIGSMVWWMKAADAGKPVTWEPWLTVLAFVLILGAVLYLNLATYAEEYHRQQTVWAAGV